MITESWRGNCDPELESYTNGKLHIFASTQSTQRTHLAIAGQLGLDPSDVVFVGEYCGGGFGSKIAGAPIYVVTALLAQKIGRPVMLRITRYEENYIGRGRPGFQAWTKIGWRRDGRVTGIDLYIVQENGPNSGFGDYSSAAGAVSIVYTPLAMRFRGLPVLTNTPARGAQRGPGQNQFAEAIEPVLSKAARMLDIDQVEIRKINAVSSDSTFGPRQATVTSAFQREALDKGADKFNWEEKKQLSGQRRGSKVIGVGTVITLVATGWGVSGVIIGNMVGFMVAGAALVGVAYPKIAQAWGGSWHHRGRIICTTREH